MDQSPIPRASAAVTLAACFIIGFGSGMILGYSLNYGNTDRWNAATPYIITGGTFGATALVLRLMLGRQAAWMLLGITGISLTNFGIVFGIILAS